MLIEYGDLIKYTIWLNEGEREKIYYLHFMSLEFFC